MEQTNDLLHSPYTLGGMTLKNRIVMAPMTRSRAIGNTPNDLMAEYYAQRAGAGLIITEGTAPGPNGLGYARIPGLYSDEQVQGWKKVTDAVHAKGGKIFIQLMHAGRVAHQLNLPEGGEIISASAIAAEGQMWTDSEGMKDMPTPKEIPTEGIATLIAEYVHSAKAAIAAGFDGVELHAANGYLPMQFLSPASNQRTDEYGGSTDKRNRFVLELAAAVAEAIGKEKTGIRISPFNPFNSMGADENEAEQYTALAAGLKDTGIAYVHILTFATPAELLAAIHNAFGGTLILNGGYDAARAEADLQAGKGDLISFGSAYVANPDLAERMKLKAELAKPDTATFYTADAKGYTDYPAMAQ